MYYFKYSVATNEYENASVGQKRKRCIRERRALWHENYDAEWVDGEGLFGGSIKQFNYRWEHCADYTGTLYFYREDRANGGWKSDKWIEYKAKIVNGHCVNIERI